MAAHRPVLELSILGLQPRDARPDDGSGFSSPTWTWPDDGDERPLARLLSGRYLAPSESSAGEADCREEDPDRQALAILEAHPPAEIDALTRALGDWCLSGGSREAFQERIDAWQAEGFTRLLCFDPVHLKAETDHAITLGQRFLALTAEELDGLVGELNAWLIQDDMRVERIGRQLYLLAQSRPDGFGPANTALQRGGAPLACLLNRNAGVFLNEEHSDPVLRQWLTELQMWLYPQTLNDRRAAHGQPILSSFWPHGLSALSDGMPSPPAEERLILTDSPAVIAECDASVWQADEMDTAREAIRACRPVRVLLTEAAWCRLEGDIGGFQQELARIDVWLERLQAECPDMAVRLDDGQGGVWQPESGWKRTWRRLLQRVGR